MFRMSAVALRVALGEPHDHRDVGLEVGATIDGMPCR